MGVFSWLDCISGEAIKEGQIKKSYVLVPEKFKDDFGNNGRIVETCYDGYGHFGPYDIYELVAIWNKDYLSAKLLQKPTPLSKFGGLFSFEKDALRREGKSEEEIEALDKAEQKKNYENNRRCRRETISIMRAFKNGVDEEILAEKYGDEWLRDLGVDIACEDEQNQKLPYPIKITHSATAIYEECKPSESDPKQGR